MATIGDLEPGDIITIDGQTAECASRELWERAWEGRKELPLDHVPFVIVLPNDLLDWWSVPEDAECDVIEPIDVFIGRN
jgi:hypothetical protein